MATFDQTEILWNKYKNLPTAFPTQTFLANQAVGDAFPTIIPTTQIWSSEIPATAPTALGSAVSITNGSYQQSTAYSWIRKYTITMGVIQAPVESYWYASTDPNDPLNTNEARDTIPFNFDPLGSYTIQVFANGTPVSPTFLDYPWNYDDAAGILTFYPINPLVLPPAPITMVYWRYVGNKGGSALSYWNITDPPPGTNLNFDYLGTTKAIINSSGDFDAHTITAFSFIGDGAGLTGGPASAFTSGTTAKINTIDNTTSVILYPTMVIIPTTNPAQTW